MRVTDDEVSNNLPPANLSFDKKFDVSVSSPTAFVPTDVLPPQHLSSPPLKQPPPQPQPPPPALVLVQDGQSGIFCNSSSDLPTFFYADAPTNDNFVAPVEATTAFAYDPHMASGAEVLNANQIAYCSNGQGTARKNFFIIFVFIKNILIVFLLRIIWVFFVTE